MFVVNYVLIDSRSMVASVLDKGHIYTNIDLKCKKKLTFLNDKSEFLSAYRLSIFLAILYDQMW